jgi:hypothetical protein
MSDNCLRLIPRDPNWRPTPEAAAAATALLAEAFPAAERVEARAETNVVFYDAGFNTESISCPSCGADLDAWWGDAMSEAGETGFGDLAVVTPCCASRTSLNDLDYVWPAAFGSFALEVSNPGAPSLADEQRKAVEQALGSPVDSIGAASP